jgi:hypothetical protein
MQPPVDRSVIIEVAIVECLAFVSLQRRQLHRAQLRLLLRMQRVECVCVLPQICVRGCEWPEERKRGPIATAHASRTSAHSAEASHPHKVTLHRDGAKHPAGSAVARSRDGQRPLTAGRPRAGTLAGQLPAQL